MEDEPIVISSAVTDTPEAIAGRTFPTAFRGFDQQEVRAFLSRASEELSRLLFVWMVFIGAAAAYPAGEHMAFTSLAGLLAKRPVAFGVLTALIRLLVITASTMLAWGAWQQVVVGMGSRSVVMAYPAALLPLPAFLCAVAISVMATIELFQRKPLDLGHGAEVE